LILDITHISTLPYQEHELHITHDEEDEEGNRGKCKPKEPTLVVKMITYEPIMIWIKLMAYVKSMILDIPIVICDIFPSKTWLFPYILTRRVPQKICMMIIALT